MWILVRQHEDRLAPADATYKRVTEFTSYETAQTAFDELVRTERLALRHGTYYLAEVREQASA